MRPLGFDGRAHLEDAASDRPASVDRAADLDELFRAHAPYIARIGLRMLCRRDEVDDLVQEVFEAALRGVGKVRDPEAIRGWLAAIAVRKARRHLRRRRFLRYLGMDRDHDDDDVADPGASPSVRRLLAEVASILDDMGVELRLVWTLRHLDGEDLRTIAELCSCSLSTVKRRLELAQTLMNERLSDD